VTSNNHLLVLELAGDIARAGAGNLNPGLAEEGADRDDEEDVDGGVDRVKEGQLEGARWAHVVDNTGRSVHLGCLVERLPDTEELDEEVVGEALPEHLRDDEDVACKGALQHDGHVASIEKLDGVGATLATEAVALDGDLNAEALEVDDGGEDDNGGQEVHDVGQAVAPQCLLEGTGLVVPGEEKVEEGNDSTLELGAAAGVDSRGRECLPDDGLANVGCNEKRDTGAKTVTLLEELIEEDDDEGRRHELDNEEQYDTSAEVLGLAVHSAEDVNNCLAERDDESENCRIRVSYANRRGRRELASKRNCKHAETRATRG